ncbi:MAG: thermonuclease family protein [Deferrisomatales bacterium]|nr:thermonuclease family protein [Deferrisomatales bacterium]
MSTLRTLVPEDRHVGHPVSRAPFSHPSRNERSGPDRRTVKKPVLAADPEPDPEHPMVCVELPEKSRSNRPDLGIALIALVLCAGFLLTACSGGGEHTGKVLNVIEGDLLKVEMDGRWMRVELAGVDSPVRGQPYRDEARAFTVRLVQDKTITVRVVDTGAAGHVVGEVLFGAGKTLNRELVAAGLAWHRGSWFAPYPELRAAEQQARRARRGLWRDPDPVPPWEFLGDKSWRDGKEQ